MSGKDAARARFRAGPRRPLFWGARPNGRLHRPLPRDGHALPGQKARGAGNGLLSLELNRTFDAVYALNSLLHVPKADLPAVLARVGVHLKPSGLFYFGVSGVIDFESILPDDQHEPKRFFAYYEDHDLLRRVMSAFELVYFPRVSHAREPDADFHFQSMV